MITAILVLSILNVALQVFAAYQRHITIQEHRRSNGDDRREVNVYVA